MLDQMTKNLVEHSQKTTTALQTYVEGVNAMFGHMDIVVDAAVTDSEKVQMRTLNQKYGLPPGTIAPGKNLYPTIPSEYVGTCNKGDNYLHTLPLDVQSMLVACVVVSQKGTAQKIPTSHGRAFNQGMQFGELGFKSLSSFRTL